MRDLRCAPLLGPPANDSGGATRTMPLRGWAMRALALFLLVAGCQSNPLLVVSLAEKTLIEASYTEGGRTVVLRARPGLSEVIDERGHSMSALANSILRRERLALPAL